jgi:hypothetical protein
MGLSPYKKNLIILITLCSLIPIGIAQRGGDETRSIDLSWIFNGGFDQHIYHYENKTVYYLQQTGYLLKVISIITALGVAVYTTFR